MIQTRPRLAAESGDPGWMCPTPLHYVLGLRASLLACGANTNLLPKTWLSRRRRFAFRALPDRGADNAMKCGACHG
jgi:hypothetical protein